MELEDVSFRYGWRSRWVLRELSWQVPEGRTVLLGPNGAGKTTLLSLCASALRPSAGRVRLGELDTRSRRDLRGYRRLVGWMPQQIRAVPGLTAREQVAYAGWLKGLSRTEAWQRAQKALEAVGLSSRLQDKTSTLSGGQLRRLGLAQVLVHSPQVAILDEPTAGLDPAQRARFGEVLAALSLGSHVIVSTHQVDDLSQLYDTVAVMASGKIVFEGAVGDFLRLGEGNDREAEAAYSLLVREED